jgi:hypothetical protein
MKNERTYPAEWDAADIRLYEACLRLFWRARMHPEEYAADLGDDDLGEAQDTPTLH